MVDLCYGDYLAEILNAEYVHLAKGASSNDRIWRKSSELILSDQIDTNDILLVQYTDIHRREFPSVEFHHDFVPDQHFNLPHEQVQSILNPADDYWVSDYKMDSHTWVRNPSDKHLHQTYQTYGVSDVFDQNYFVLRHNQFAALCAMHHINLIVFDTRYIKSQYLEIGKGSLSFKIIKEDVFPEIHGENHWKYELGYTQQQPDFWDSSHMSSLGHEYVAQCIAQALWPHSGVDICH